MKEELGLRIRKSLYRSLINQHLVKLDEEGLLKVLLIIHNSTGEIGEVKGLTDTELKERLLKEHDESKKVQPPSESKVEPLNTVVSELSEYLKYVPLIDYLDVNLLYKEVKFGDNCWAARVKFIANDSEGYDYELQWWETKKRYPKINLVPEVVDFKSFVRWFDEFGS